MAVKISFLGDISFNNQYIELYNRGINPFKEVAPYLFASDFVVGNLECTVSNNSGENKLKKPRLKTNLQTLNFLNYLNLHYVTLANNHVYDNLDKGLKMAIEFLNNDKISYTGVGYNEV